MGGQRVLTWIFLIVFHVSFSQQPAGISGYISGSDNEPVPFANLYIPELKSGAAADESGFYRFHNLEPGTWQLSISAVGYHTTTQTIRVTDGIQTMNFVLDINNNELSQVEVFGNRNDRPDKIEALTRLPLKPYEQIQSISVISEKLIEQQADLTIASVTQNVAGVYSFATYGNKRESMSSRGFRGIPILKNGVRVHSDFRGVGILTDMQGVDNIQVLKGSAAITQGVATDLGSPGGVVNIVTKTPKFTSGGSAGLRIGSYGQVRPVFDVYGPMNSGKNLAFRLNGAMERADSYRSLVNQERFYFNPSMAWNIDEQTQITFEMDHFYDSRTPDLGTVNLAANDENAIYKLPHSSFLGFKSDRSVTLNSTYALRVDHNLSKNLSLKGAFYHSGLKLDDKGAGLGNPVREGEITQYHLRQRSYTAATRDDKNSVLQFDLIGDNIHTGSVKHTFQIGFDYHSGSFHSQTQNSAVLDTINVFEEIDNRLPETVLGDPVITRGRTQAVGLVAQDVISWNRWLKTFLGLRFSSTETIAEEETSRSNAVNPLGGIIVSPVKNLNFFVSYTNSSYPRTASLLGRNGEELGNERFDQWETGIKSSWLSDRLRFNLTLYRINNTNINLPFYDETWTHILYYVKGGNDRRQGIEVELTGRPLPNLELITGYSYIDARYKDHTSFVYGSAPLNTPKHTFNAYANYQFSRFLEGFSVGAGVYYIGKRPVNDWSSGPVTHQGIVPGQKPFDIEANTRVNLQLGYRISASWSVRAVIDNLFDSVGYNAYRTRFINQTEPRSFAGIVRYDF